MSTRDRPSSVISLKMVLMTEGVLSFGQKRVGIGRKFVWAPVGLVAVEGGGGGGGRAAGGVSGAVGPATKSAPPAPTGGVGRGGWSPELAGPDGEGVAL